MLLKGLGYRKTYEKMEQAQVVVFLLEASKFISQEDALKLEVAKIHNKYPQKAILIIANKIDQVSGGRKKENRERI